MRWAARGRRASPVVHATEEHRFLRWQGIHRHPRYVPRTVATRHVFPRPWRSSRDERPAVSVRPCDLPPVIADRDLAVHSARRRCSTPSHLAVRPQAIASGRHRARLGRDVRDEVRLLNDGDVVNEVVNEGEVVREANRALAVVLAVVVAACGIAVATHTLAGSAPAPRAIVVTPDAPQPVSSLDTPSATRPPASADARSGSTTTP